ncbi:uncharacterized protein N7469_003175 [Penicillium citrinum]|uniref:Amidase domain-containing protein n=1 Tax=Penicillium citrinum TaxID=5077 RepID=A0A9W9TW14_PENCI|nr:uncharacterized protein N7469_003175 [Penicillium citrinum]KAJ5241584.1 hypothetical protein N7469_003175 [Penicillium citrinum]
MGSHAGKSTSTIDVTELTIPTFHAALRKGQTSITSVINTYLARIAQHEPTLKSLITINPNAIKEAYQKDIETEQFLNDPSTTGFAFPPLHGVAVLLKDNYTTHDLPTSAGCKALATLTSQNDSQVVQFLRKAGAIILAKTNLHEFALHGTTTSSLGGQTLNPYDLTRTPGGSSGGTGAALAMNLGMVGCGTDTVNSLRSPASSCSIVGFRPSVGVILTTGIVPVSETQDVAGPMARCVNDVRILFDVMRGDEQSTILKSARIEGKSQLRIGVLEEYFCLEGSSNSNNTINPDVLAENAIIQDIIRKALSSVSSTSTSINISLIPIPKHPSAWSVSTLLEKADTQIYEFQEVLNEFLASQSIISPHKTLQSIANSGEYHQDAITSVFSLPLSNPKIYSCTSVEYKSRLSYISSLKQSVRDIFAQYAVDVLVYPHQRQFPVPIGETIQPNRNGILAALTGRPAICIPAGFSPPTLSAPSGIPIGLELMGQERGDEGLLDLAEVFERVLRARRVPFTQ